MSVLSSRAVHEQLSVIMGALTRAAVTDICQLVDEGYALLQLEIRRSHQENQDLRRKLHLIQSIVVRGSGGAEGGGAAEEPEPGPAPEESAQQAEAAQQHRDSDGGDAAAPVLREELPDVVLIKDEDSDADDSFEDGETTPDDGGGAAARERGGRSMKRRWPGSEETDRKSPSEPLTLKTAGTQKKSVTVFSLDSPRSEPGCSGEVCGDELDVGGGESVCSYTSQMDPDVQLVHQECSLFPPSSNRQTYFGNGALMESHSPTGKAELDLSLTWTKPSKGQMAFAQFHQSENLDADAFGLKMVSVTGSTSTDCQLSESSNSAYEYDDGDLNFPLYRDPSGRPQLCNGQPGARGKRFVCAICSKTYATSQNLEVHMRIHTGERPFSCSQCGKKFTQSAHLKSHLSVHSGERPYTCTFCSRSFIVKYSLKLHMKKCHSDAIPTSHGHPDAMSSSHSHPDAIPTSHGHPDAIPTSHSHSDAIPSSHSHPNAIPSSHSHPDAMSSSHSHPHD